MSMDFSELSLRLNTSKYFESELYSYLKYKLEAIYDVYF